MNLFELFPQSLYEEMLDKRYIREQNHPTLDLRIINYTESAQFDKLWNAVTSKCRGLIVNSANEVIARPFDKFMNYGENQADKILMDYSVEVTDKLDGSLGILWQYQGYWGIATRGSFISDQAVHATKLLHTKYESFHAIPGMTYMFEIIYPGNKIVLDYGERDELILLGYRDTASDAVYAAESLLDWHWGRTHTFSYKTLREALEAPTRHNAEGFVVYFPELDYRIKIKQDDYIAMHKMVFGLTKRRCWRVLKEGGTLETLYRQAPDEWHSWVKQVWREINLNFMLTLESVNALHADVLSQMPENWTKKDYARVVGKRPLFGLAYLRLNGNNARLYEQIWKLIYPDAE